MRKQVLFLHGGAGKTDYEADSALVDSMKEILGDAYMVHYPLLPKGTAPDFGRMKQIRSELSKIHGDVILVGHSLGASMLLKYLSEQEIKQTISGVFLIATPFWSGHEDWVKGLRLQKNFANALPKEIPFFFYHCEDDEEVPFDQLSLYAKKLPQATIRRIASGGHQLNNDLSMVTKDIMSV